VCISCRSRSDWGTAHSPPLDVYGDYINADVALPADLARPVAAKIDTVTNVVPLERKAR